MMVEIIELRREVIIRLQRKGGVLKETQRNTQNAALNVDLI